MVAVAVVDEVVVVVEVVKTDTTKTGSLNLMSIPGTDSSTTVTPKVMTVQT